MRTLMVLALAVLTVMAVAQDEAKEVKRYEVAVDTDEFVAGLDSLADVVKKHLSGPSEEYYQIVLTKHKAYGAIAKVVGVISAAALLLCMGFIGWAIHSRNDSFGAPALVMGILWLITLVPFSMYCGDIIAPEYYALQEVIKTAVRFMP